MVELVERGPRGVECDGATVAAARELAAQAPQRGGAVETSHRSRLGPRELQCALVIVVGQLCERGVGHVARDAALRERLRDDPAPLPLARHARVHDLLQQEIHQALAQLATLPERVGPDARQEAAAT